MRLLRLIAVTMAIVAVAGVIAMAIIVISTQVQSRVVPPPYSCAVEVDESGARDASCLLTDTTPPAITPCTTPNRPWTCGTARLRGADKNVAPRALNNLGKAPAAVQCWSLQPTPGPQPGLDFGQIDSVIAGGESGSGARTMAAKWVRDMFAQCRQPGVQTVPFVQQLGSVSGCDGGAGPKGDGWDKWPEDLKVREFPRAEEVVA